MDRKLNVSEAEIQDAFASMLGLAVDEDDPSFLTAMQIAQRLNVDRQVIERRLKQALRDGRTEVRRVRRQSEDGRMRILAVYRPIQAEVKP